MQLVHSVPLAFHQMRCYRRYLLGCKKKWGTARGLIHYRVMLAQYQFAKQLIEAAHAAQLWTITC